GRRRRRRGGRRRGRRRGRGRRGGRAAAGQRPGLAAAGAAVVVDRFLALRPPVGGVGLALVDDDGALRVGDRRVPGGTVGRVGGHRGRGNRRCDGRREGGQHLQSLL